jgi:hypothetical protein
VTGAFRALAAQASLRDGVLDRRKPLPHHLR